MMSGGVARVGRIGIIALNLDAGANETPERLLIGLVHCCNLLRRFLVVEAKHIDGIFDGVDELSFASIHIVGVLRG